MLEFFEGAAVCVMVMTGSALTLLVVVSILKDLRK